MGKMNEGDLKQSVLSCRQSPWTLTSSSTEWQMFLHVLTPSHFSGVKGGGRGICMFHQLYSMGSPQNTVSNPRVTEVGFPVSTKSQFQNGSWEIWLESHVVWRPLSKNVLACTVVWMTSLSIIVWPFCVCIHSSTPKPRPCSSWSTRAHKQKVPLLSPWNKQEGPLGLWSHGFSPAPNFFRLFTENRVIATSCSASCLSTRKALLWHEVLWAANYL